jgi:uncharacterized protein (DUF1501 family)
MTKNFNQKRRRFLQKAALASGTSFAVMQGKLDLISAALAATGDYSGFSDYKSLVCVFLGGGIDTLNMFIPYATVRYNVYATVRQNLAIPRDQLLPVTGNNDAFHPSCAGLRTLYNEGRLGVVANMGSLFQPITRTEYLARPRTVLVPPDLFSHSHQTETWQTNVAASASTVNPGWGGKLSELLAAANAAANNIPASYTLSGNNLWQSGNSTRPFAVRPGQGIGSFEAFDNGTWPPSEPGRSAIWNRILGLNRTHVLERQAAGLFVDTQRKADQLREALASSPTITTPYNSNNPLASQLRAAAQLIAIRQVLGIKRQILYVSLGGWDTHDSQLDTQSRRLATLSEALLSFYRTTQELGIANSVTTFTASEFGRTLTSNVDGTDHAWASDGLVLGGAVAGGRIHGSPIAYTDVPELTSGGTQMFGPDDVGSGRFIPKYSVDQYGATMAKWMGVVDADLPLIFPNLNRFSVKTLGFIA